jgi:hypothetical protein
MQARPNAFGSKKQARNWGTFPVRNSYSDGTEGSSPQNTTTGL